MNKGFWKMLMVGGIMLSFLVALPLCQLLLDFADCLAKVVQAMSCMTLKSSILVYHLLHLKIKSQK